VIINSSTSITAIAPSGAAGAISVTVPTAGGTSTGATYTYDGVPTIAYLNPAGGPLAGGTSVLIVGTSFTPDSTVFFGKTPAVSVTFESSNFLTVLAPAMAAGPVNVTVTADGGTNGPTTTYTLRRPPTITGLSPAQGAVAGGTTVNITGTNFFPTSTVTFGGNAATVTYNSSTSLTVVTPSGTVGLTSATVTAFGGSAVSSAYTYITAPAVAVFAPNVGPAAAGTVVQVVGSNFTAGSTVYFGSTAATTTYNRPLLLTAIAPAGSSNVSLSVIAQGEPAPQHPAPSPTPQISIP